MSRVNERVHYGVEYKEPIESMCSDWFDTAEEAYDALAFWILNHAASNPKMVGAEARARYCSGKKQKRLARYLRWLDSKGY